MNLVKMLQFTVDIHKSQHRQGHYTSKLVTNLRAQGGCINTSPLEIYPKVIEALINMKNVYGL